MHQIARHRHWTVIGDNSKPVGGIGGKFGFVTVAVCFSCGQGIRLIDDGEDSFYNLEYDSGNAAGSVQYIVAGRYLMEVKIQRLPLECFQVMEHRDGLLAALHRHLLKQGALPMSGKK